MTGATAGAWRAHLHTSKTPRRPTALHCTASPPTRTKEVPRPSRFLNPPARNVSNRRRRGRRVAGCCHMQPCPPMSGDFHSSERKSRAMNHSSTAHTYTTLCCGRGLVPAGPAEPQGQIKLDIKSKKEEKKKPNKRKRNYPSSDYRDAQIVSYGLTNLESSRQTSTTSRTTTTSLPGRTYCVDAQRRRVVHRVWLSSPLTLPSLLFPCSWVHFAPRGPRFPHLLDRSGKPESDTVNRVES